MHMADALLSPTVGAVMWTATAVITVYSARKVQNQLDNKKIPKFVYSEGFGADTGFVLALWLIRARMSREI